jgi:AraC-like DNA-binding protein
MVELNEGFIPSLYTRITARVLKLQHRDLPKLLSGSELPSSILMPGDDTLITAGSQMIILDNARALYGQPGFGLVVGSQLTPNTFGPIGYLALSSPTVLRALRALRDFLPLRISFTHIEIETVGSDLCCRLKLTVPVSHENRVHLTECFALVIKALIDAVTGGGLDGLRFSFSYAPPSYAAQYREALDAPVEFNQAQDAVWLPLSQVNIANVSSDTASYQKARDLCEELLQSTPRKQLTLADRLRQLMLSQPAATVSEEKLAAAMFTSKRTIARRLAAEGTSYRQVRDATLAELAARHLEETSLSTEAIAAILGYNDVANFRRACRRWFGVPPSVVRARGLHPNDDES